MRARTPGGALPVAAACAVLALAIGGAGCGTTFKLPTEHVENRGIPSNGSYQMIATWTGLTGVTDALLIPGPQLYLLFKGNPGRVEEYSTTSPFPLATGRFAGLLNPGALASDGNSVYVLDQGDTLDARTTLLNAYYVLDCGPMTGFSRPLVDISKYWWVREYDLKGRTLRGSFTDTTFAYVNGVAVDAQGRVYVSGVIYACLVDRFDPRLRTLDFQFRIHRYVRGSGDPFVIGGWKRDTSFTIPDGTGLGSARDARGMVWTSATGAALFFADHGNNEVQKYDILGDIGNSFKIDLCDGDTTLLAAPRDVSVDGSGDVFVVDTGNRRVLRFDAAGLHCLQRVDIEPDTRGQRLTLPVAAAADRVNGEDEVYVVDAGANEVVRYRRRK